MKIAANAEGKHYMALTSEREVYSWGEGDGGRLGHGDNMYVYNDCVLFISRGAEGPGREILHPSVGRYCIRLSVRLSVRHV